MQLEIPVTRTAYELPPGYRLTSAADTDIHQLMALDDALRNDVPGAEGWESNETTFREQTYDSHTSTPRHTSSRWTPATRTPGWSGSGTDRAHYPASA